MFKVGQVYKATKQNGFGLPNEAVEVVSCDPERGIAHVTPIGQSTTRFYTITSVMVLEGALELVNPFSHLYTKNGNLYVIKTDSHISSIKIHTSNDGVHLKGGDEETSIYWDELESLLAVLLDIHKEKYGK